MMIGNKIKKIVAVLLSVLMIIASVPMSVIAAEIDTIAETETVATEPKVEIVSFMRGKQEDYRSSELLEVKVTGYDGNLQELSYEWTNTLGTYLYLYNSHNMYYIQGTEGEVEIYNLDKTVPPSTNMGDRAYDGTFAGVGFRWAAIYGSNINGDRTGVYNDDIRDEDAYNGTISVTVRDKDGNVVGTASHTGKVSRYFDWQSFRYKYTYDGIVDYNLQDDIDHVVVGMFYGDKRNVKNLLGESGVVHITCEESNVTNASVTSGEEYIKLTQENGDYYIEAIKEPDDNEIGPQSNLQIDIAKNQCKFHEFTSGTAYPKVYVFKKPTTDTTAYTLTLVDNLDSRCDYFIDGRQGVKQEDGTILFDGLTPNTEYMVEVRGKYEDNNGNTKYAYAYVYDTTKPVYTGTVEVYLDGTYDSATHTATGTRVNLEDVSAYSTVYAKEVNSDKFIQLTKKDDPKGVYSSLLDRGSYQFYYTDNVDTKIDEQLMYMHESDRTRYLFYNSVKYIVDGELVETQYHVTDSAVNVRTEVPTKEGYVFTGWQAQDGKIYQSNEVLTQNIAQPYVLTAQWEEGIDVYVNITIDHYAKNKGHNYEDIDRHNVSFDLMSKDAGAEGNYADVFTAPVELNWNGVSEFNSEYYVAEHNYNDAADEDLTTYKNTVKPLLTNVLPGKDYTVEVAKTSYEIKSITTTSVNSDGNGYEKGDVIVDVVLVFEPKNADLDFKVRFDDASTEIIRKHPQYKPAAVNEKVLSWYTKEYNNGKIQPNTWEHITQHHDTFVTLYIGDNVDENFEVEGSYPVWMHNNKEGENREYYYYRIKVVSYVLQDGTIINTNNVEGFENIKYLTPGERYLATISVTDKEAPDNNTPVGSSLSGANFIDSTTQSADLLGEIHINTHKVTFIPNGGQFADGVTSDKVATNQIVMPNLDDYTVTRDGGYVFDGWEVIEGENITEPVTSGVNLYSDVVLKAKWRDPLTVQGTVFVAGYYHSDDNPDEITIINAPSRTHHVTVYLQRLLPNGYAETVDSQKIHLVYSDAGALEPVEKPMGSARYVFTGLPDDGHKYRILINNANYTELYQNEPDSIDSVKMTAFDDEESYNENNFNANFKEAEPQNVADINAFMEFLPQEVTLNYSVDANAIGEKCRPQSTEVLILSDEDPTIVNPHSWPAISAMVDNKVETGQTTTLDADGKGSGSHEVWRIKEDGHSLYNYALRLKDYTQYNGTEVAFDSANAPFFAYYNGTANFNENGEQSQPLTITLYPKNYAVRFHLGFEQNNEDHITGMDKYLLDEQGYRTYHTWSFDTLITDAIPERAGYKFLGWYDSPEENAKKVTNEKGEIEIDATVANDTDLYARWEEGYKVIFHANNSDYKGDDIFRTYYPADVTLPEGDTNFALNADYTLNSFYDIPEFEYNTHNKYVFKGWYDVEGRPIDWVNDTYTQETHIYAQWILVEDVEKDAADTKHYDNSGKYPGYDLLGVQIRDVEKDDVQHYGEEGKGLRFVTVLSEDVYQQINALHSANASGAEYGYALAKTATAKKYANGIADHEIEYKDGNVNGKDTTTSHKYVSNVKCSGVPDHFNGGSYRLYTAVVTYKNLEGDQLAAAKASELLARSYIRYTDANGLLRTHYNNYTGNNVYSGCSASFDIAAALLNNTAA